MVQQRGVAVTCLTAVTSVFFGWWAVKSLIAGDFVSTDRRTGAEVHTTFAAAPWIFSFLLVAFSAAAIFLAYWTVWNIRSFSADGQPSFWAEARVRLAPPARIAFASALLLQLLILVLRWLEPGVRHAPAAVLLMIAAPPVAVLSSLLLFRRRDQQHRGWFQRLWERLEFTAWLALFSLLLSLVFLGGA
jgi:hypothetical protein